MSPVHIEELNPETRERVLAKISPDSDLTVEPAEQVPEVEARIIEEMTAKVFTPVRDITAKAHRGIKTVIEENAPLFAKARSMFAAQGRRVPVAGKPTWNEWLKANLPCSDRYVRQVLAGIGEEPKEESQVDLDESPLSEAFDALSPFFGEGPRCPLNILPTARGWVKQHQPLTVPQIETLLAIVNVLGQISKLASEFQTEFAAVLKREEVTA